MRSIPRNMFCFACKVQSKWWCYVSDATTPRFQCRESAVQECDVYCLGCRWPREIEAPVEALLQQHRWLGMFIYFGVKRNLQNDNVLYPLLCNHSAYWAVLFKMVEICGSRKYIVMWFLLPIYDLQSCFWKYLFSELAWNWG